MCGCFFFVKQKTAYEMRISDWSSDVCASDLGKADVIILAVLFEGHRDVAKALPDWQGKTIIDAMNTNDPVEDLDGLPSTDFAATSFPGARFVTGFNHLLARTMATDPNVEGGHRALFLPHDSESTTEPVADVGKP